MEPRFDSQVNEYQTKQRRRQRWYKVVSVLACVVVFCTTYALILPAITMEAPRVLDCPLAVHAHTAECYDEDDNLICGQADFVVHTHNDDCYGDDGTLVCALPEIKAHEHTDECYVEERTLICGEEEDLGHEHTEECFTWTQANLICGQEEEPGHEHTEDCYRVERALVCGEDEDPGHTHSEACYEQAPRKLICTLEESSEHQHTKECYVTCGLEEDLGHPHSPECYETTQELTCGLDEDGEHEHTEECYAEVKTLICGEREPGHTHSEECYAETQTLICEEEERSSGHVHDTYCYDWKQELTCEEEVRPAGHIHTDECYRIETVRTCEEEEIILHTHTDECYEDIYDEEGEWIKRTLICGQLEILEHVHTDECFHIVEEEVFTGPYAYEDDSVAVEVTLAEGSTVPEGAELVVRPITGMATFSADGGGDYDYEELVRQAEEAVDKEVAEIVLYDISFYTLEGEYLPVADTATVSLRFKEAVLTGDMGEVAVLHYREDAAPVALESVDVERDEDDALSGVTFQTEGFSVFGVAMLADTKAGTDASFTLTYNGNTITFNIVDEKGNAIAGDYSDYHIDAVGATQYIFSKIVPEIKGYTYSGAKYGTIGVVSVATTGFTNSGGTDATNFTTAFQVYENDPIQAGKWYSGNTFEITLTYTNDSAEPTDYSGDWAIVNLKSGSISGVAMLASTNSSGNLAGQTVTVEQKDGSYLVSDPIVTVWHFEKSGNDDGTYYISTTVDGNTKYLTIGQYITLSDSPQAITVEGGTGTYSGMVRLTYPIDGKNIAVNLFGGSAAQGFGSYPSDNSGNDWHTLCQVTGAQDGTLQYNLNLPNIYLIGTSWQQTPTLNSTSQDMTMATALFAKPNNSYNETGPAGISGLYRFDIADPDRLIPGSNNTESWSGEPFYTKDDFDWYGEYRFDGWEYVDENKVTHLFAPGAEVMPAEDGGIQVTDVDGKEVTLPAAGATLTGKWTEVSNVVTMFVNYTGTILDVEGDVSGRNGNNFTKSVAVGHVFYGKKTVGKNDTFGTDANAAISAMFRPSFNPADPDTQIVIEYLRRCTKGSTTGTGYETSVDKESLGANSNVLEENTLKLIKETGRTIRLSTSNTGNPEVDNALCDTDHYQIRWYVLKEQADTWHIDGVLVANTEELAVTKTFTGLSDDQVDDLLDEENGNGFNIAVALGEKGASQPYITMLPQNQSNGKQYVYMGQDTSIHSYHWTLYAINGEKYTLTENRYTLDGYDVSSIVVEYYLDENGDTKIHYTYGDSTDNFSFSDGIPQVEGGRTIAVSFNNLYTKTGTGAFAITKREKGTDPSSVGGMLPNAVFKLTPQGTGTAQTATSNANGTVYFNNLSEGTYTLEETKAPDGYTVSDHTWTVVVENTDGHVGVTVYENDASGAMLTSDSGTVCYDSNSGGVQKSYEIYNTPNRNAVTVRKTFTGMTLEELEAVVAQSKTDLKGTSSGYYIQLQGEVNSGTPHEGETIKATLTLDQAQPLQDGRTFIWTIHNLHVDNTTYTITEHNYLHNSYIDAVVSARLNGTSVAATEDAASGTCQISGVQFREDASDTVTITNHYTNTFDLKLKKEDSVTHQPLEGAVFDIYGNYNDSTDVHKTVTYEENGVTKTAYYIGTTSHSGADGIASYSGLRLSKEGSTFVYVIKEFQSPNGYVKLDEPIIHTVTIDSDGYDGGVFTFTAKNTRDKDYVHRTLDTAKVWDPSPPAGATVTLELYQVVHEKRGVPLGAVADAVLVASVSLDGTADLETTVADDEITAYESASWVATWTNLPSAAESYDADEKHYHYFVREAVTVNGYATSYTCYDLYDEVPDGAIQTLRVTKEDGSIETFQGVLIADMDDAYTATVVNTSNFELPETGGMGTLPYAMGGALLIAASLLYGYLLRRKKERRSAR